MEHASYSKDKNCYSIIRNIDERNRISENNEEYYSFLLEYPQIPKYIHFRQSSFKSSVVDSYQEIYSNGTWTNFGGFYLYQKSALFSGDINPGHWNYPIGVKGTSYYPFMPSYGYNIQVMDLWIQIKNVRMPFFCTEKMNYRLYIPFSNYLVFISLY